MHEKLTRFPLASTTGKLFRLLHFNASIAFSALTSCGNVSTSLHAECISESRILKASFCLLPVELKCSISGSGSKLDV